jgi:glucose-1-phosphate adenylyltransferase
VSSLPIGLDVLAVVQAGGRGTRMDVLTRERPKPALPFAATHQLIDFPLSALAASGVRDVWVSLQFQSGALDDYLAGGRPWDLDRTRGGLRRMTPEQGSGSAQQEGFSHGNADGLFRIADDVQVRDPDVLLVLSADHVFNADLRPAIAAHLEHGSACTLLTSQVGVQEATQKMVVEARVDGLVTRVQNKPQGPGSGLVATEIFVYDPSVLLPELARLRRQLQPDGSDTGLGDFGDHLLPDLVDRGAVRAEPLPGYWKDVGRPTAYLQAHRDLLAGRVDVFAHPERPVLSPPVPGPPAWVGAGAVVEDTMLGPGCRVRGRVEGSVLGPGVEVQAGAVVTGSVLLGDTVVRAGAQVHSSVLDRGVVVGQGASVGAPLPGTRIGDEAIVLVGKDCRIAGGAVVPAGARLEPGTST